MGLHLSLFLTSTRSLQLYVNNQLTVLWLNHFQDSWTKWMFDLVWCDLSWLWIKMKSLQPLLKICWECQLYQRGFLFVDVSWFIGVYASSVKDALTLWWIGIQPGGYNIPANTAMLVNTYSIGRDPQVWKDPVQFNPNRFMAGGSSSMIKANGLDFNLLPFGSGRRACPGYNLAILLLLRTTATLVHAFDWAPPPGCSQEDLSIDEAGSFLIHPSSVLYLVPTPRLSSHVYKSNVTWLDLV